MPEVFVDVYEKFLAGDMEAAKVVQRRAAKVAGLLRYGSDMSIFKSVLSARGISGGSVRKPLLDIENPEKTAIIEALKPFFS
ncbi:hypothetical protein FACS189468_0600 [Spirochaetia bacterium]|nr:hypothetical protein FACS189468_0600 [Spirochaetia bacterium]